MAGGGELVDATGRWRVRPVRVERGGRLIEVLRVEHYGFLVADCLSVAEVGRHVDLATLRPAGQPDPEDGADGYGDPADPVGDDDTCE